MNKLPLVKPNRIQNRADNALTVTVTFDAAKLQRKIKELLVLKAPAICANLSTNSTRGKLAVSANTEWVFYFLNHFVTSGLEQKEIFLYHVG